MSFGAELLESQKASTDALRRLAEAVAHGEDGFLTDQEAADFLKISLDRLRRSAPELVASGAAVLELNGRGSGKRPERRWRKSSLLALARGVER